MSAIFVPNVSEATSLHESICTSVFKGKNVVQKNVKNVNNINGMHAIFVFISLKTKS